jgi:succinyl-diaminopimelate desuccinylase
VERFDIVEELKNKIPSDCTVSADNEYITLVTKGIAKHASVPEGSVNAGCVASKVLLGCESLCENDKKILSISEKLLESGFGEGADMEHTDEIFGKLTMVNGIISTENKRLKLSFDIRYGSSLPANEAEKRAHKGIEKLGWIATDVENMEGFLISKDSKIPDVLVETYNEMTGFNKDKITMAGGTYARFLKNAFSVGTFTGYKARTSIPLEMPAGHGGAHEKDEKIDLDEFFFALRILMQYVLQADALI